MDTLDMNEERRTKGTAGCVMDEEDGETLRGALLDVGASLVHAAGRRRLGLR